MIIPEFGLQSICIYMCVCVCPYIKWRCAATLLGGELLPPAATQTSYLAGQATTWQQTRDKDAHEPCRLSA